MIIRSPAFANNETMPSLYARQGGDISPPLQFNDVPAGTKSLALVCHDPDAPRTEGWTHWVVWGIDPTVKGFPEGGVPAGATQGTTDWGETKWGGPQPPSGTHHYNFYLYALDILLGLPATTMRQQLEQAMRGHVIETATLTGLFSAGA